MPSYSTIRMRGWRAAISAQPASRAISVAEVPAEAALRATALARSGDLHALMKGSLHTDELMAAIVTRAPACAAARASATPSCSTCRATPSCSRWPTASQHRAASARQARHPHQRDRPAADAGHRAPQVRYRRGRRDSEPHDPGPAPRSFSEQMRQLDTSLRKVADMHLHQPVRKSEVLPSAPQVDFRGALDVLLSEVVRLLQ